MANTLLLKRRIKTAQNVSKTTKAMQMIAASKLKRAQNAALSSRPYVKKLTGLVKTLSAKLPIEKQHIYMRGNSADKTLLIVISPDKGLCGGLITNLLREYFNYHKNEQYIVITVGKKVEHAASRNTNSLIASFPIGNTLPQFEATRPLQKIIDEYYLSGKIGQVKVLYSNFVSVFAQVPTVSTLLPVSIDEPYLVYQTTNTKVALEKTPVKNAFQLYEPSIEKILPSLLKHSTEMTLFQYFLEAHLSEQAARMLAMQNATDNARDIITQLTLEYNKARQEKITNEILDISSGATASYE